jgi:hypothetical protein
MRKFDDVQLDDSRRIAAKSGNGAAFVVEGMKLLIKPLVVKHAMLAKSKCGRVTGSD